MGVSIDDLTSSQRSHIIRVMRRELMCYGCLPSIWKRHSARTADRLAEQYGVPRADVLKLWKAWVDGRREREWQRQHAAFQARIEAGMIPATSNPHPEMSLR